LPNSICKGTSKFLYASGVIKNYILPVLSRNNFDEFLRIFVNDLIPLKIQTIHRIVYFQKF
jgi:hypothetical protein